MRYETYSQLTKEQQDEYKCYDTSAFRVLTMIGGCTFIIVNSVILFALSSKSYLLLGLLFFCIIISTIFLLFLMVIFVSLIIKMSKWKKLHNIKSKGLANFEV